MIKKLPIPVNQYPNQYPNQYLNKYLDKYIDTSILLAIAIAWLMANLRVLQCLFESIAESSWFNKILIVSVISVLIVWSFLAYKTNPKIRERVRFSNSAIPVQPLILIATTAIAAIIWQWTVELPQVSAILFLLGSYGLCGIFLESSMWRRGFAIALTISIVLPFSLQFTSGLGLAARVLTAHLVEQILAFWHLSAISSSDIIVLENGIAHVDLPCSGLRSLWTGTVFLLATTWIEGRKLGFIWLLVYVGCLLLLISANVGRVLLLTIATFVLKQPLLADLIHLPLGLFGFIGACGMAWLALRFVPKFNSEKYNSDPVLPNSKTIQSQSISSSNIVQNSALFSAQRFRLLLFALLISILIFASIPRPNFGNNLASENLKWTPIDLTKNQLAKEIHAQPLALTAQEFEFFGNSAIATKQKFEFHGLTGSMLLVSSNSWRTHHAPELCLVGNGLKVDKMTSTQLTESFPVRWLNLQDGKMSAMYWFQSASQTTDELLTRIWSEISYRDRAWMMVSILFDQKQAADDPEVLAFANSIRDSLFSKITSSKK
jgi:exosortase O